MTIFPLAGADYHANRFNGPGLQKAEFFKYYENIFDETSKKAILSAGAKNLKPNSFGAQGPIGRPDALVLAVKYDNGDGIESGQYFGFAKDSTGKFKLIFAVWAD